MSGIPSVCVHQFQKDTFDLSKVSAYRSQRPIKYFKILGERCSGTHFVQYAMKQNFDISFKHGDSHFFGHDPLDISDDTLLICVVRHSVDWIDSFFKRLHHIPPMNKISIKAFVTNEFYSIYEEGIQIYQEIPNDRNWITKKRYTNVFDLRHHKQKYFLEEVPKNVQNYIILPYEYLRDHYDEAMEKIRYIFLLNRKRLELSPIIKYKGSYNVDFKIKNIILTKKYEDLILSSVNAEQESLLGYHTSRSLQDDLEKTGDEEHRVL